MALGQHYVVVGLLNRVDTSTAQDIEWPALP
ncbi:tail fiber assembly protein [Escherichia coli]